ncbi:aldolase/citrate lyase family protein [Inquilinus sp. CAU 1745]|uniref:HpcH/HpaI aldolase family protein n=1 Tax=Inquilinus sp. CAU 1745 TaxID=3140369 RepID=UPI00325A7953
MFRRNALKDRLKNGRAGLGCWLTTGNPVISEVVALSGYDAIMLDHEHGPGTFPDAIACLQAISGTPTTGLMRVPWNDPIYLKRALDIGVEGVMIPSISTAGEAEEAVAACRYPPRGRRGVAYTIARAADYGNAVARYEAEAEEELLIIVQIETAEGFANIESIAAVDGIDMLFIGPNDLSGSLGRLREFDHPEIRGAILDAEKRIKTTGKWLGSLPSLGRDPAAMAAAGVDFVVASADLGLLRGGAAAEVDAFRG